MTGRAFALFLILALRINVFGQLWEEINAKGINYYNKKNFKKAIAFFEQGLTKAETEFGTNHENYYSACYNLASVYQNLNRPERAIPLYRSYFQWAVEKNKIKKEEEARELINTGNYAARHSYYADAVFFWAAGRDAFAKMPDGNPELVAIACTNVAIGFKRIDLPDSAEVNLQRALLLYEQIKGKCSGDYYETLMSLISLFAENRDRFSKEKIQSSIEQAHSCAIRLYGIMSNEYLQAVANLADLSLLTEDYHKGLIYLDACLNALSTQANAPTDQLAELMINKAYALRELGKLSEGEDWLFRAKSLLENEQAKHPAQYSSVLIRLSGFKLLMGDFAEAEYWLNSAEEFNKRYLNDDEKQATILSNRARIYFLKGDIQRAEALYQQYFQYAKSKEQENPRQYYSACNALGLFFFEAGYYEKALHLFQESCGLSRRLYGNDSNKYAEDCINLAGVYVKLEKFTDAELKLTEALSILESAGRHDTESYALALFLLADVHDEYAMHEKSGTLRADALHIYQKIYGSGHYKFAQAASSMAIALFRQGRFSEAEQLHLQALDIFKKSLGEKQPDYAAQCYHLGTTYHYTGQFSLAEQWLFKARAIQEELFGKNHPSYGKTLYELGSLYHDMGDYAKAEALYTDAKTIAENSVGKFHSHYLRVINSLGVLYNDVGQYHKSEKILRDILVTTGELRGKNHPDYALASANLAALLTDAGNYAEAATLLDEALLVMANTKGRHNLDYGGICENMAYYLNRLNEYQKAEKYYEEIRTLRAELQGRNHVEYVQACNNLAYTKNRIGNYKEAELLYQEARAALVHQGLKRHSLYATVCNNLASVYEEQQKHQEAFSLYTQAARVFVNELNSNFILFSESEREKYLEEFNYFRDIYFSFTLDVADQIKESLSWAFRYNLLTKGALYRAAKNFREAFQSWTNTAASRLFDQYRSLKAAYAKALTLNEQQLKERNINLLQLREQIAEAEKNLLRSSDVLNRAVADTLYTWKDVQKLLKPDEALIEWVRLEYYHNEWKDSVLYLAFIIRHGQILPDYMVLRNGKDLEGKEIKFYTNSVMAGIENLRSYNVFWKPLEPKLRHVRKVYVVPDGIYHTINLNTLYNPATGKYLADEYSIHLLGSSLDFMHYFGKPVLQKRNYRQYNTWLFGYPNYTGTEPTQQVTEKTRERVVNLFRGDSTQRFFDLDGGHVTVLEGTRIEVDEINKILKSKGIQSTVLTGNDASEKQLKQLQSPDVLHLATHGFFLRQYDRLDPEKQIRVKENPLMRSGLLMAGAELGLRGERTTFDEDGILFAQEVQLLDLKNTELVVLSACETGLGEIKHGEGVYGLQRALQEAGAKNIIMSLWKVDDQVTQQLMTQFYTLLFSGKSKRSAFQEAQSIIRQQYPQPYYWGAFVMIGE
ncbi:MAG: hypothetical protein KatS3mg032_1375 [Cyclobacteriaceae bacterium]|nr:MAG: hypothetical protein KatS3mg032_1375 [Cyclobacteriaceae bacterium]